MAFRPLATAGIAFAAAGVMAFTPTIVPQLTEREEQVAKATSANVKLAADLKDLINVYFGTNPYNGIPFDANNPGLFGTSGVVYQLLKEQAGAYAPNQRFLDSFFGSGASQVVYDYLASGTAPGSDTRAYLDAFFNQSGAANPALFGTSGVIFLRLMASDLTLEQKQVINDLFTGGFTEVSRTQLLSRFTDPAQRTFINDFYDGGTTQLAYRQLGGDFDNPDTSSTPYLSSFFNINNPYGDPNAAGVNTGVSSNPGLYGASGVAFRRIQEAAATGNISPDQYLVLQDFFQGGATQVALTQLLARTADPNQRNIINEFFANGVAGVVRYLLVGPAPTPPPTPPVTPPVTPPPNTLLAASVEEVTPGPDVEALTAPAPQARSARVADAPAPEAPAPDKPAAITPVAVVESAPAVQPAPVVVPAPVAAPAPEPIAKPTSKIREKSAEEEAEAEKLKSGNKAEVEPIILTGDGPKSGEGSWGVFGDIANSIGQALNGGGAAPAGGATGGTGGDGAGAAG